MQLLPRPKSTGIYVFPDFSKVIPSAVYKGKWFARFPDHTRVRADGKPTEYFDSPQEAANALRYMGFGPAWFELVRDESFVKFIDESVPSLRNAWRKTSGQSLNDDETFQLRQVLEDFFREVAARQTT